MKKSDLKTGMLVETKGEGTWIVVKDVNTTHYGHQEFILSKEGEFLIGSEYNNDMTRKGSDKFTITKVYSICSESHILRGTLDGRTLVWEREPQPIEMTLAEACKKLRDTMGQPVKITI